MKLLQAQCLWPQIQTMLFVTCHPMFSHYCFTPAIGRVGACAQTSTTWTQSKLQNDILQKPPGWNSILPPESVKITLSMQPNCVSKADIYRRVKSCKNSTLTNYTLAQYEVVERSLLKVHSVTSPSWELRVWCRLQRLIKAIKVFEDPKKFLILGEKMNQSTEEIVKISGFNKYTPVSLLYREPLE